MSLLPSPNTAHRRVRSLLFLCWLGVSVATGWAADSAVREFDIPAGAAGRTLKVFAQQGGREIVFSLESIGDTQTNAVRGTFSPREVLEKMLAGTGLVAGMEEKSGVFSVRKGAADPNAQRAVPSARSDRPRQLPIRDDETIELSPFVVNVDQDKGYAATTTLSGTRLATNLRDTAGSLSIVTPELMADLNVTSIEEAVLYFPSGNEDLGSPIGGVLQAGNTNRSNPDTRKIRGISTTASSRNFFPVAGPIDLYNSERLTSANGPNAILFGTGGVEGATVTSTKQARVDRSIYDVGTRFDSNGSRRFTFDVNQPAGPHLALRVNTLHDDHEGFRDGETSEQRRVNVAGTIKPLRHTVVRFDYEHFLAKVNAVPLKWAMDDGYQSWLTAGQPLVDTLVTGVWTAAQTARFGSVMSQSGQAIAYMGNRPGGAATQNTFRLAALVSRPFGNGSVTNYQVPDPMATYGLPRDANLMPGTKAQPHNVKGGHNMSAFVEQRISENFFVELAANRTRLNTQQRNATMDSIQIDPNRFLTDGTANPGYQQLYAQTAARQSLVLVEDNDWRATLSYELDLQRVQRLLGRHRFAGLWEIDRNVQKNNNEFVVNTVLDGSNPLNRNPLNAQNRLNFRSYYLPQAGVIRPQTVYDVFDQPSLADVPDPRNPGKYLYKFSAESTQGPSISESRQESRAAVWQGFFLNDRVVTTLGYRRDVIETWALRTEDWKLRDGTPYYARATVSAIPGSQAPDERYTGTTRTVGVVGHAAKWLSLTYNQSDVFNPPVGLNGIYSADGTPLGPETGKTKEFGFRLYLFGDRLTLSASHYDAATRGTSQFNPANNTFIGPRNSIYARLQLNWAGTGLVSNIPPEDLVQLQSIRGLTDTKLSGWEATAVFNPTRNWRILVTGSINETVEENRYQAIKALLERDLPLIESWSTQLDRIRTTSTNPTTAALAATDRTFVSDRLLGLRTALADANATEGRDLASVGKYALNAVSSYGFSEGRLAGWRATGRARYRSAPVIGYYRDANRLIQIDRPYRGSEFIDVGAQVGRTFKFNQRQVEVRLDVANLFDFDKPLPQLADTDDFAVFGKPGEMRVVRWALQRPRTYTLTFNVRF